MSQALELIEAKKLENAPIGEYEWIPITKGKWRFGPFLKWGTLYINIPKMIDMETISLDQAFDLIEKKQLKESTRYIRRFPEEGIDIENGRFGPFIKYKKKNLYLKIKGKKITDQDAIAALTIEDIKSIITEQMPWAFTPPWKKSKKK